MQVDILNVRHSDAVRSPALFGSVRLLCEGRILELTDTTVILETTEGRASLPAKVFNEQPIVLVVSGGAGWLAARI